MKKIVLLVFAAILFTSITSEQISKGSLFTGGSFSISSDKTKSSPSANVETTNSNWSIRPQIGKAVQNNKVVGLFFNVGGSLNKQTSTPSNLSQTKNSFYGGGVFLRNYFAIANRFYLFGDASLGITSSQNKSLNDNGTTQYIYATSKNLQSTLSLTPGVSFAASKKIHLEAAFNNLLFLSYTSTKSIEYSSPGVLFRETKNKNLTASGNVNGFTNLYLGIRFIIP